MRKLYIFLVMSIFVTGILSMDSRAADPPLGAPTGTGRVDPAEDLSNSKGSQEFSGHYVFNGKLFYYDQDSGEFTPVKNSEEKEKDKEKADISLPEAIAEPKIPAENELIEELKKDEFIPVKNDGAYSLAKIASGAQEYDTERFACETWASHLIKDKTFKSEEDCEDELQKKKEEALLTIDAYIEKFDKAKTELLIKSELADYERLSKIKLKKNKSVKIILKAFKKGCKCIE